MMHKGVLMDIQIDEVATPLSDEMARRYFKEMMLGIEYCKVVIYSVNTYILTK
jgi:hypothetical protein